MALNTTGSVNTGTGALATKPQAFYDKVLLEVRRQKTFYHRQLAQVRPMPKKSGDTINFRKIGKLNVATTPLTEGVTPSSENATISAISATTKQYGSYMEFTDVVDFQMVDPILKEYALEQANQANETLDVLTRDELAAGSNVFYANAKASRATLAAGDKPTLKDFRKIVLSMKKNHVKPAQNGQYVAIVSPAIAFDLLDDPDFIKIMDYGNTNKPLMENEVGKAYGITFVEQVNAKDFPGAGATGANVHAAIVLGNQAYGTVNIAGEGDIKTIVKPLGSSGTADPLSQRQTMAWKVNAFVAKRLDETAIARYECVPTQG
jgi:N4-gp56 family major capsid protein